MMSLLEIFLVFAKIGAFTIGGGYAMIPVIEGEMKKRKWIEESQISDIVVLAQSAPGLLAVNMAIFAGYRLRGLKGSIAATLGAILPSFVSILVIAMAFSTFRENVMVAKFFQALRPVAIALILVPMFKMALQGCRSRSQWAIMIITLVLIALLKVSPIWILLTIIAVSTTVAVLKKS